VRECGATHRENIDPNSRYVRGDRLVIRAKVIFLAIAQRIQRPRRYHRARVPSQSLDALAARGHVHEQTPLLAPPLGLEQGELHTARDGIVTRAAASGLIAVGF
jgi:hypothetical protein